MLVRCCSLSGLSLLLAGFLLATLLAASPSYGSDCNQGTTIGSDGTVLYGTSCPEIIVVTDPEIEKVLGGDGSDLIIVNPNVETVNGGLGDDIIFGELSDSVIQTPLASRWLRRHSRAAKRGSPILLNTVPCPGGTCYGGMGNQTLIGGSGADSIFGMRGNDALYGNEGNDNLSGGIGDDGKDSNDVDWKVLGGAGNDVVSGGHGADDVNGGADNDLVRGDGTIDAIADNSGSNDTISFATGVTPGFGGSAPSLTGFPTDAEDQERGVSVRLDGSNASCGFEACNNGAAFGGGNDSIVASDFENVIGTAYADYIIGSSAANRIDGGGGSDVIDGSGGNDSIYGGADGDYLQGGTGTDTGNGEAGSNNCNADVENKQSCSGSSQAVTQRDRTKIAAGLMMTSSLPSYIRTTSAYLTGSDTARDHVDITYSVVNGVRHVIFSAQTDSATFDLSANGQSAGCSYQTTEVDCTLTLPLDSLVVSGMAYGDELAISGFPETTSPLILGGTGSDVLSGSGGTEDSLVDGPGTGNDFLASFGYDDVLMNNDGSDTLQGGNGNDLFLSASVCDADSINGAGPGASNDGINNASWAKMTSSKVVADLASSSAGNLNGPSCSSGTLDSLSNILDLEGSPQFDGLFGGGGDNQLLGNAGGDTLLGRNGKDDILARDGEIDSVDCGPNDGVSDPPVVDKRIIGDPTSDPVNDAVSNCP